MGQTIGQQSQNNAPTQLNLFDRVKPNVEKFEADILDLEDIVDDDIVQNDGDEHIVLELFGKLEDVANTEAILDTFLTVRLKTPSEQGASLLRSTV